MLMPKPDAVTTRPMPTLLDRDGIGGNMPPDPLEILRDDLSEKASVLIARRKAIEASLPMVPERIEDEDTAAGVIDLLDIVAKCKKAAEAMHKVEKEPYLEGGRVVDRFFNATLFDPFDAIRKRLDPQRVDWLSRKAATEKRRRDEAARLAQEEADRLAREAAAAAAAIQTDADLEAAILAEEAATVAVADVARTEKDAGAKLADLSRARGTLGTASSLRTRWVGEIVDLATLDLEALRPHLPSDALQQAVNAFVRAKGRELRGAKIHELAY